jgi:hypothetical protein
MIIKYTTLYFFEYSANIKQFKIKSMDLNEVYRPITYYVITVSTITCLGNNIPCEFYVI